MNTDCSWMWHRLTDKGYLSNEFVQRLKEFLDSIFDDPKNVRLGKIRCPCSKCATRYLLSRSQVHIHIANNGFYGYTTRRAPAEESSLYNSGSNNGYDDGSGITSVVMEPKQHIAKTGWSNTSTQRSFDLSSGHGEVSGGPSKGNVDVYGRCSERVVGYDERINELTNEVYDMRAAILKMREELLRRQDENIRMLEQALSSTVEMQELMRRQDENKRMLEQALEKNKEEARKREAGLQEMVSKLIQDAMIWTSRAT